MGRGMSVKCQYCTTVPYSITRYTVGYSMCSCSTV